MSKASFEVGENEKHVIFVHASPLWKYIRVEVDGKKVLHVANLTPTRKLELDIGETEKHHLEIDLRALTPTKLFVDGKEVPQI